MSQFRESLVPWDTQPQEAVGIDWGNPLTQGLAHIYNPVVGPLESRPIVSGSMQLVTKSRGVALSPLSTQSGHFSSSPAGEVTFLAVIERNLKSYSDTYGDAILRYGSNSFGSTFGTGLSIPGYLNGVVLRFAVRQASGAGEISIDDTVAASSGSRYQVVVGRYRKNEIFDLNINGVITTGTPTANAVDSSFYNRIYTGGNTSNPQSEGGVYLAATWNRAISEAEVKLLLDNPWQLFAPQRLTLPMVTPVLPSRKYRESLLPWDSQPQESVGVDASLSSSLAYLWEGNELIRPKFGATSFVNTSGAIRGGQRGLQAYFATDAYLLAQNYSPIVTSDGSFTGDFTAIIYGVAPATGIRTLFAQRTNTDSLPQFGITAGYDAAFGALSGSVQFATYSGAIVACSLAGGADGLAHVYAIRRQGTEVSGWIDGRKVASTTGTAQAIGSATAGLGIGCAPAGTGTANTQQTAVVGFAAGFNAALPDGYLAYIGRNVDAIYAPRSIWVPIAAPVVIKQRVREVLVPWDSQPQESVGVDWGNPLAQGLVFDLLGAVDTVSKTNLLKQGTPSLVATTNGIATRFVRSSTQGYILGAEDKYRPAEITLFAVVKVASFPAAAGQTVIARDDLTLGRGFDLDIHSNFGPGLRYYVNGTGSISGGGPLVVDRYYAIAATQKGANAAIYVDGRMVASSSGFASIPLATGATTIGYRTYSGSNEPLDGDVAVARIWNRALSDAEVKSLSANPWQIFAPRLIRIPISTGTGRIYYVIGPDAGWATPTDAEIRAGKLAGGATPTAYGSEVSPTVTTAPFTLSADATGLLASTAYRVAYVWSDS